jgi:hypothetical protein
MGGNSPNYTGKNVLHPLATIGTGGGERWLCPRSIFGYARDG